MWHTSNECECLELLWRMSIGHFFTMHGGHRIIQSMQIFTQRTTLGKCSDFMPCQESFFLWFLINTPKISDSNGRTNNEFRFDAEKKRKKKTNKFQSQMSIMTIEFIQMNLTVLFVASRQWILCGCELRTYGVCEETKCPNEYEVQSIKRRIEWKTRTINSIKS